jgi:dipeptidase
MRSSAPAPSPLLGCDTLVALAPAALRGAAIFAKNSDRPPGEPQALAAVERARHPGGARVRCQYVEVAQVRETARLVGAGPTWLWGLEMGLNEHGVAIGNETIFAHEAPAATGLIGMDLVRLGLERGASAASAVEVLIELIETHGQGGSGYRDLDWPYNNGFLVADPREAFVLEAAGKLWATRRCTTVDAISNHVTIGADWQRLSRAAPETAAARGLTVAEPLDFAATFRDTSLVPPALSEGRLRRSRSLLAEGRGAHTVETLQAILRDHDQTGPRFVPGAAPDEEQFYTLCMHQGPSRTAASLVAELEATPREPRLAWFALGRPCTSAFFPVFFAGELPAVLTGAGDEGTHDAPGLWWVFERLAERAERSEPVAERIRAALVALEQELRAAAVEWCRTAAGHGEDEAERHATAANAAVAGRLDAGARQILAACRG